MTETVGVSGGSPPGVAAAVRGLSREGLAQRLARDLKDGYVVNLGVGIPLLIPRFIPPDAEVILHAENGVLGLGPTAPPGREDPDLTDAGKQPATLISGAAIVDSAMSFAIVRGGHLDVTVLGALQVSAEGDLANWYVPGKNPAVGGAMDLAIGAKRLWVAMEHVTKEGASRIVRSCSYPLTAKGVVQRVYTNLAVLDVTPRGFVVRDMVPGLTFEALQARSTATLHREA